MIIDYSLKSEPKGDITLEILDAQGQLVRKFSSKKKKQEGESDFFGMRGNPVLPKKAGLNRFVWDMKYEPPREVPGAVYDNGPPEGILALPGKYVARLTVEGKPYSAPIELLSDPRAKISEADLQKQFTLATQVRDLTDSDHKTVLEIRDLRSQLDALDKRLGKGEGDKAVRSAADDLKKKISTIEDQLISSKSTANEDQLNYGNMLSSQLAYLENSLDDSDVAVPQAEIAQVGVFRGQMEKLETDWRTVVKKDIADLNELMRKNHIAAIGVSAPADKEDSEN